MTRNRLRRSLLQGCSVISVIALTCTTQRTVPHRRKCQNRLHIPPTMAIRGKSGPTAISVRSLATGQNPVMMIRPFEVYSTRARTISIFAHHDYSMWGFGLYMCILCASCCLVSLLSTLVLIQQNDFSESLSKKVLIIIHCS